MTTLEACQYWRSCVINIVDEHITAERSKDEGAALGYRHCGRSGRGRRCAQAQKGGSMTLCEVTVLGWAVRCEEDPESFGLWTEIDIPKDHIVLSIGHARLPELFGSNIVEMIEPRVAGNMMVRNTLVLTHRRGWLEGLNRDEQIEAMQAEALRIIKGLQGLTEEWWARVQVQYLALRATLAEVASSS